MKHKISPKAYHLFIILGLLLAYAPAAYSVPLSLPVTGNELIIPYAPVAIPDSTSADVTYVKPLGLGDLAIGGAVLSPKVDLDFNGAADLYVGLSTTIAPGEFFFLWQDGNFHKLSEGIMPWMERTEGLSTWLLDSDIALADLRPYPGTYNLYLMAVPYGTDLQTNFPYYLWNTSFVVTPSSLSLSATNIDFGVSSGPKSQDLSLTNTSGSPYAISVTLNDPSGVFSITANNCPQILLPQQSCKVTLTVNPGAVVPGGTESVDINISMGSQDAVACDPTEACVSAAAASPLTLLIPIYVKPVTATPCVYTVGNAVPATFATGGGTGTISVTAAPADCAGTWTAVSNNLDWITITSANSGSGSGTITFSIAGGYTGTAARSGSITVNGAAKTITQNGQTVIDCSKPTLTPSSKSFGAAATTGTIQLSTGATCAWNASGFFLSPWLRVTSASSGTGPATISYAVDAYSGSGTRTGSLYIAGKTFTGTQTGGGCSYTVSPGSASFDSGAHTGQFSVALSSSCTAVSPALTTNADWIHLSTSTKTSAGYTIGFSIDANTGTQRTGTIMVAGTREFNISQSGGGTVTPGCTYTLNPVSKTYAIAGGQNQTFQVTVSGTGCSWTPTSSDTTWLTVVSPTSAQTAGATVTFNVAANDAANAPARNGFITVGDKNLSVYQDGNTPVTPTTLRYESFEGRWNAPEYFNFTAITPNGAGPSQGRPVKFLKITVPPDGCPANRIEFWLSGMGQNGNMLVAGPDAEFGSLENAWAVYNEKKALPQGSYEFGPSYWFHFMNLSANETLIVTGPNELYKGRTFYIMVVNEGPNGTIYRVGAYCI